MNFTRGLNPKEAMGTGKYANPKRVRCLKNVYSETYKKLAFKRNDKYTFAKLDTGIYMVDDILDRGHMFGDERFRQFFEIYD